MIIEQGSKLLVLRFRDYKKYSFIDEHSLLASIHNGVWMLKLGKTIPASSLDATVGATKLLLLKAPKSTGGQIYVSSCTKYHNGLPAPTDIYPKYYDEMLSEYYWLSNDGTWFMLGSIKPLEQEYYSSLLLLKNGKPLMQAINETRTVYMLVQNNSPITV